MFRRLPNSLWLVAILATSGCDLLADLGEERIVVAGASSRGGGGTGGTPVVASSGAGGDTGGGPACDPEGDVVWLRTFGDFGYDEPGSAAPDGDGGFYLSGVFDGTVDLGAGPLSTAGGRDIFLARVDGDGRALWSKRFGTPLPDQVGPWVAPHPNGFVICGINGTLLDFGGGAHAAQDDDAYVALLDPQGALIWEHWLEGPGLQACWGGVAVDPSSGDVFAGVLFKGELEVDGTVLNGAPNDTEGDALLLRLDGADGSVEAMRHWGDQGQDHIKRLAVLNDGTVVMSAYTEGAVDLGQGLLPDGPGSDIVLARFNPDLTPIWGHVFPSSGPSGGLGVLASKSGDLVFTVNLHGTVDLGTGPITTEPRSSAIARISVATGFATEVATLPGFDAPSWLAEASDGAIVVGGGYTYDLAVGGINRPSGGGGNSQPDPVLIKVSPDLQTVDWLQFASDSKKWEMFGSVVLGDDDTVMVTGYFHEQLDVDGCTTRVSAGESDALFMKRKL